jgi:branched-chain amino acid transport system permease protein
VDSQIFLLLVQDGLTTGAIYLLLAVGLLLVFSVTRVILIPQGDFVAYGALGFAALLAGQVPGTLWLLDGLALASAAWSMLWPEEGQSRSRMLAWRLVPPAALTAAALLLAPRHAPAPVLGVLAVLIVAALGPLLYRFAYAPMARASVLALLILSMAVHYVLLGIGLLSFGAEGSRTPALSTADYPVGPLDVSGQSLWIFGVCALLVACLRFVFARTLLGRALRAASSNALGARLMGIDEGTTGRLAFLLAAGIGALAGLLIAPITPIGYDTGFEIGLKGFVAAIIGGLSSYPLAALGALVVGVVESLSSFWASSYREVIVFTLIVPVLVWLSLTRGRLDGGGLGGDG